MGWLWLVQVVIGGQVFGASGRCCFFWVSDNLKLIFLEPVFVQEFVFCLMS